MKLGILIKPYRLETIEVALQKIRDAGYDEITLGTPSMSNLPEDHCNAEELLRDSGKLKAYMELIESYGLKVSTIQCTANPVHPQKAVAQQHDKELRDSILLAEKMGVDNVSTFSGCPGDHPGAKYPNWIAYAWPYDHGEVLKWQWEEVLIPYWKDLAAFSRSCGIRKVGLEFHPNFSVFNPKTLRRLRDAVGEEIGACLDVSHLFWMGMDPATVIRELKDCTFQFHAKDTIINEDEVKKNGVIELGPFSDAENRAWRFGIPGYGHSDVQWRQIIVALREIGYTEALTFEHEDIMFGRDEGIRRNFEFLNSIIIRDPAENCAWTEGVKEARFPHLREGIK